MPHQEFENWTSHGWGIEVNTPRQALDLISHIALLAQGRTYAWRGQHDAAYRFSSSLYRRLELSDVSVTEAAMRKAENDILEEARRWGLGRDLGPSATDLHLLATLQHHGVPTRLVDVTSNPMTALWFAVEEHPSSDGQVADTAGVLFAIDVTDTDHYQTFQHHGRLTIGQVENPLGAIYNAALDASSELKSPKPTIFRAFPALPDDRMTAQEGYFLGSAVPKRHRVPGVLGLNPGGQAPGNDKLQKLLASERGPGRPVTLPFCAIVIPAKVKKQLRDPLRRTYNRRRRVLFPDIDGFKEAFVADQLEY